MSHRGVSDFNTIHCLSGKWGTGRLGIVDVVVVAFVGYQAAWTKAPLGAHNWQSSSTRGISFRSFFLLFLEVRFFLGQSFYAVRHLCAALRRLLPWASGSGISPCFLGPSTSRKVVLMGVEGGTSADEIRVCLRACGIAGPRRQGRERRRGVDSGDDDMTAVGEIRRRFLSFWATEAHGGNDELI